MNDVRMIAVAAGRGGTGKSTLAFALADALRHKFPDQRVVILDLDPQAGVTGYARVEAAPNPVTDPPVPLGDITLFRGGRALASASETEIRQHINRAVSGDDTLVVVDMAPALTDLMHRVIFDRPDVLVLGAIKTEPASFKSCNELVQLASAKGLPYILVPTIHRKILVNSTMLLTLQQQHSGHVADTIIPLDGKAVECVVAGKPVTTYARRSRAAMAVAQLVDEIFDEEA